MGVECLDNSILYQHISELFKEDMVQTSLIDKLREENLQLRSEIFHLNLELYDKKNKKELKLEERTTCEYQLLRNDLKLLNEQTRDIQEELRNRDVEANRIKYYRNKCATMEIECNQRIQNQNVHYHKIIEDLSNELSTLSEQLIESQQESLKQDELVRDTSVLETTLEELETQNDLLQKTIEQYECKLIKADTELQSLNFENANLKRDLREINYIINDKDKLIQDIYVENEKLIADNKLKNRYCNCVKSTNEVETNTLNEQIRELKYLLCRKQCETDRLTAMLQRRDEDIKRLCQNINDEKNRLTNESLVLIETVGELKNKIAQTENLSQKLEKDLTKASNKLLEAAHRENDLQTELLAKSEKLSYLEQEEYKLREVVDDISQELYHSKTEQKRRETKILDDLNMNKQKFKELENEFKKTKNDFEVILDCNEELKKKIDCNNTETCQLKEDSYVLREKIASLEGRESALCDILRATQEEVNTSKQELCQIMQLNEDLTNFKQKYCKVMMHNNELVKKYTNLQQVYNKLNEEYRIVCDVKEQANATLDAARKWQVEQREREKCINEKIQIQNEHVRTLLQDRKSLISKINSMHRDNVILNCELEKRKEIASDQHGCTSSSSYLPLRDYYLKASKRVVNAYSSDTDINDSENMLKEMRFTTKKMYRTRKYWQDGLQEVVK